MVMAMVMAMAMVMTTLMKIPVMIDCHHHALFDCDDGAKSIEISKDMIEASFKQGVHTLVLTPHFNSKETKVSREEHQIRFEMLKQALKTIPIQLILGVELYIGQRLPNVDFDQLTYGPHQTLLVEFSPFMETQIVDLVFNLIKKGYQVVIAHIERYPYLSYEDLIELKQIGAILQVNTSSILKIGHPEYAKRGRDYVRKGLVDIVATDSHNMESRPPNMLKAFEALKDLVGEEKAISMTGQFQFEHILS
jgi:protein-tyrosine phosphatase